MATGVRMVDCQEVTLAEASRLPSVGRPEVALRLVVGTMVVLAAVVAVMGAVVGAVVVAVVGVAVDVVGRPQSPQEAERGEPEWAVSQRERCR